MRKNKYKIQIGDVLYEASKMYGKVIEWRINDIFVEHYMGGDKTILTVESPVYGRSEKFLSDVTHWHDTDEEAKAAFAANM